jgi:nicotinate-nucleotide adenylyltransferase
MPRLAPDTSNKVERIALYGGVFDPVHNAHLSVAKAALKGVDLDQVIFLPAARSPHKNEGPLATDEQRLAMLRSATQGVSAFSVDPWELERGGISYSVETAARFRGLFPAAQLFWIIGADHWAQLPNWNRIEELSQSVDFLVMARPGYRLEPPTWPAIRHHLVAAPLFPESSSEIRDRAASGRSIAGLVAPAVEAFISANNLYNSGE